MRWIILALCVLIGAGAAWAAEPPCVAAQIIGSTDRPAAACVVFDTERGTQTLRITPATPYLMTITLEMEGPVPLYTYQAQGPHDNTNAFNPLVTQIRIVEHTPARDAVTVLRWPQPVTPLPSPTPTEAVPAPRLEPRSYLPTL